MAYYDFNAVLALPSGPCTCNVDPGKCEPHIILKHSSRVVLSMSRWVSPVKKVGRTDIKEMKASGRNAILVTVEEGKATPDDDLDLLSLEQFNNSKSSRLTIFGHGDPGSTTVGRRSPTALAELILVGCGIRKVTKISLLACYGAGNFNVKEGQAGHVGVNDSFARDFHAQLVQAVEGKSLFTKVTARTRALVIDSTLERLAAMPDKSLKHKPHDTKFVFEWLADGDTYEQQFNVLNKA